MENNEQEFTPPLELELPKAPPFMDFMAIQFQSEQSALATGLLRMEIVAESVEITDHATFQTAGELLRSIATAKKSWKKLWLEYWEKPREAAAEFLRRIGDADKSVSGRFDRARAAIEGKMRQFQQVDQERTAKLNERILAAGDEARSTLLMQGRVAEAAMVPVAPALPKVRVRIKDVPQVEDIVVEITDLEKVLAGVVAGSIPLYVNIKGVSVPLIEVRETALKELRKSLGASFAPEGVAFSTRTSYRPRTGKI